TLIPRPPATQELRLQRSSTMPLAALPPFAAPARTLVIAAAAILAAGGATAQPVAPPEPIINPDAMRKVSEHVYVIPDDYVGFVPNVGIVVGDRATLVIDTGMGERNGRIVLEQ